MLLVMLLKLGARKISCSLQKCSLCNASMLIFCKHKWLIFQSLQFTSEYTAWHSASHNAMCHTFHFQCNENQNFSNLWFTLCFYMMLQLICIGNRTSNTELNMRCDNVNSQWGKISIQPSLYLHLNLLKKHDHRWGHKVKFDSTHWG